MIAADSPVGPGLLPHELRTPRTYVVEPDLFAIRDLCERHSGELRQWSRIDGLLPTSAAILAVLSAFRGLRPGRDGCGIQVPVRAWCRILGRRERSVHAAFEQLVARGFVRRHRRVRRVAAITGGRVKAWVDARGRSHSHADCHAVAYLSPAGARRIERRGEIRRRSTARRSPAPDGRHAVQEGVVGDLLRTLGRILKLIARRVAPVPAHCTPYEDLGQKITTDRPGGPQAVGGSGARGPPDGEAGGGVAYGDGDRKGNAARRPPEKASQGVVRGSWGARGHAAAAEVWTAELERCWAARSFTAAIAYPEAWARANDLQRQRMTEAFASIRRALIRRLLEEMRHA